MLYYRGKFADRLDIVEYDRTCHDMLVEASNIIGVPVDLARA